MNISVSSELLFTLGVNLNNLHNNNINDTINIDIAVLENNLYMTKKQLIDKFLQEHTIYQDKDGYNVVYIPDSQKKWRKRRSKDINKIYDLIYDYMKEEESNPLVKDIFYQWMDERLKLGVIRGSTHLRNTQCFERHFSSFGNKRIKELTPYDVTTFLLAEIKEKQLTKKGFSILKEITKGLLKYANSKNLISFPVKQTFDDIDTSTVVFRKNYHKDEDEIFNDEEMRKLKEYLIHHIDLNNLGILLILISGLRSGELVALRYDNFISDTIFRVEQTEAVEKDKNGKRIRVLHATKSEAGIRTVVIHKDYDWIIHAIKQFNPDGPYLFMKKGQRMTTDSIRKRLYRICDKIGIPKKSPHKGRKTTASIYADNQVGEKTTTSQLGHTDYKCTKEYYIKDRHTLEERQDIFNTIPDLGMSSEEKEAIKDIFNTLFSPQPA